MTSMEVPPEILEGIFSNVSLRESLNSITSPSPALIRTKLDETDDLAALCLTCRQWNVWASPLLYRRVQIRIGDGDVSQDPPPAWIAALRALWYNHRQRQAVSSLAIQKGLDAFVGDSPVDLTGASMLLHDLLWASIADMHQLKELVYVDSHVRSKLAGHSLTASLAGGKCQSHRNRGFYDASPKGGS